MPEVETYLMGKQNVLFRHLERNQLKRWAIDYHDAVSVNTQMSPI